MTAFFKKAKFFIIIVLLYILCITVILNIVYIPTDSMEPTIKEGSYAIELRLPFIISKNPEIQRGNIISFTHSESTHTLCKRVIGIAGDKINFLNGDVYINGRKQEENYCRFPHTSFSEKSYEVPEGCVFCMGDNRQNSKDCRTYDYPYINIRDIRGKILFSYQFPKWIHSH